MMVLAGHRAKAADLPEEPFERFHPAAQIRREKSPGFLGEIDEDRAGFENGQGRATVARIVVNDCRNAVIGRYRQKFRLELVPPAEIDRMDRVGGPRLFQEERDFMSIGGGSIIQVDHRLWGVMHRLATVRTAMLGFLRTRSAK